MVLSQEKAKAGEIIDVQASASDPENLPLQWAWKWEKTAGENTGVKQQGDGGGNDLKMANLPTGKMIEREICIEFEQQSMMDW